jgi:hypothetical protein
MPVSMTASAATSGKKYMSLKQVVPERNISAIARRVPVRTKSSPTKRPSAGQIQSCSHSIKAWSSARPRSRVMAAWQ